MWQRVQATHKKSGAVKTVDMNVFPSTEILKYGRIWFPVAEFDNHQVVPTGEKNNAGREQREAV